MVRTDSLCCLLLASPMAASVPAGALASTPERRRGGVRHSSMHPGPPTAKPLDQTFSACLQNCNHSHGPETTPAWNTKHLLELQHRPREVGDGVVVNPQRLHRPHLQGALIEQRQPSGKIDNTTRCGQQAINRTFLPLGSTKTFRKKQRKVFSAMLDGRSGRFDTRESWELSALGPRAPCERAFRITQAAKLLEALLP